MYGFEFKAPVESPELEELRKEVRAFLKDELAQRSPRARAESWNGHDVEFSKKLGQQGWIGMTWPKEYGGQERSSIERYVVLEELLAAGAPVAAHWIADRQSGPLLLEHASESQKSDILPKIAAGECYFCIGMSEPDSGSDLAAVRTRAKEVEGGFVVNGTKLWTTYGHKAHYMILFCRTDEGESRHDGMSQFLVDLKTPGISINPVLDMSGEHHFNETVFEDVFLPSECLIGERGQGWAQVMSELAFERSGPERFLSSFALIEAMVQKIKHNPSEKTRETIGRLSSHLLTMRRLSRSVAKMLQDGENPQLQASLVKDLGAVFEQSIPEITRGLVAVEPSLVGTQEYARVQAYTQLNVPSFSLRGGTREILRGIIARGLGVR